MPTVTDSPVQTARSSSRPQIDYAALQRSEPASVSLEQELMQDSDFMDRVRSWLKTEEQRMFFDFVREVPMAFAMEHAGERWTEERIADHLKIGLDRIPSLKKSLRRAFKRQLKLIHLER
jgi:hypothetical protein